MNFIRAAFAVCTLAAALFAGGCASSGSSEKQGETATQASQPPAAQPGQNEGNPAAQRGDTLEASRQNSSKPSYEPSNTNPVAGSFAVQVGAYKMQDNAERVAALARERFGKNVVTTFDKVKGLYKVLVGSFIVKDDARKFRDDMAQQYPGDYKDAWVSEIPAQ